MLFRSGSGLTLSGTGNQDPQAGVFVNNELNNLNINNSTGITLADNILVTGTMTLTTGTLNIADYTLTFSGNSPSVTAGNINATEGTVDFSNSSPITLPSSLFTGSVKNLNLNGAGGLVLGHDLTITGTLGLTSGKITLGNYNLLLNTVNAISGTPGSSSYLVYSGTGSLSKMIPATMNSAYLFPIGTAANYSPATFKLSSGSVDGSSQLTVSLTEGKQPNIGTAVNYINRYWTYTPSGTFTSVVYDASFSYLDADIVGNEGTIKSAKYSNGWTLYTNAVAAGNLLNISGATSFSDYTGFGNLSVTPAASSNIVCSGSPTTITANASGGDGSYSYAWSPTGSGASFSDSPVITTTYTVTVTDGGGATASSSVTVTVNALPGDKTVAAESSSVCFETGTNITIAQSDASTTYQLRNNADNSSVGSALTGNGASLSLPTGTLTATTTYNVLATLGSCTLQMTNTPTVTVNPILPVSVSVSADANPVCAGTSVSFTASPTNGGATPAYQWKVNGSNAGTSTTTSTYTYTPVNNDAVTVVMTSNATCTSGSPATSGTVTMTVQQPSYVPQIHTVAELLPASTSTSTITWYDASAGGSVLLSSEHLVNGHTYYASQTVNNIESSSRLEVVANVDPTPCAPTGSSTQSFCLSGTHTVADLTANGSGIRWYLSASGGTALLSSTVLTARDYWASQTIDCTESSSRLKVTVSSSCP